VTSSSIGIPPGPGFIASVAAATGIHHTDEYDVAQLFITHPGPRRANETTESVKDGMRRLAAALHLGPGNQEPPVIGARLMVRRSLAALDYGHDQYVMTIPGPSQDWLALVGTGGERRSVPGLSRVRAPCNRRRPRRDRHTPTRELRARRRRVGHYVRPPPVLSLARETGRPEVR
jgi:hypothetical protein